MKNVILICIALISFSCTKETITTLKGDYLYVADAAVLKTGQEIYGVVKDAKAKELAQKCAPLQLNNFDMVGVHIKGVILKNPKEDGWPEIVKIKEIIGVSASKKNDNQKQTIIIKDKQ